MAIPDYQTLMLPLLRLVAKGTVPFKDAWILIADEFSLTEQEKTAVFPSSKQPVMKNRVGWASSYLRKAGLLSVAQRGLLEITDRGRKVLNENPSTINVKYLEQFPEFLEFRTLRRTPQGSDAGVSISLSPNQETPEEVINEAHEQLKEQTLFEMLEKIKGCSPQFFENLVVDLIVKMGYGGSRHDAGKAIGKSGDEGIDGIINEDRLGLDVIYLQAKRWEGNVSRPEIQKFAGALQGKRARKGIFLTTSDFTQEASEFAKNIDAKIILLSGKQLVELMWEYSLGLSGAAIYEVKKIDQDYFIE